MFPRNKPHARQPERRAPTTNQTVYDPRQVRPPRASSRNATAVRATTRGMSAARSTRPAGNVGAANRVSSRQRVLRKRSKTVQHYNECQQTKPVP